jgi:hypothetical protein
MDALRQEDYDDDLLAHHEAAHAVAMWKLGVGVRWTSIERTPATAGDTMPARGFAYRDEHAKRYCIEQSGIVLHAGGVAEALLRPGEGVTGAGQDHDELHQLMYEVEDDGSVQIAWCGYLWQRAYEFIAWPGQWKLVVALARMLIKHRLLDGPGTERYLSRVEDTLKYDLSMPNAKLVGEVTYVCSPWHRGWYAKAVETKLPPRRTALLDNVLAIEVGAETKLVSSVLASLSTRAVRCLERANIHTMVDLERCDEWTLASIRGAGERTVREIVDAAARAGVRIEARRSQHGRARN